ncbi:Rop guanine nucleotide exchange factor 3-like protein isoform X1 [Tanacetum coccineum]
MMRIAPPEVVMMKEGVAKLLLGEDMSGGGKGVCDGFTTSSPPRKGKKGSAIWMARKDILGTKFPRTILLDETECIGLISRNEDKVRERRRIEAVKSIKVEDKNGNVGERVVKIINLVDSGKAHLGGNDYMDVLLHLGQYMELMRRVLIQSRAPA